MTKTIKNITEVACVCGQGNFIERNGRFGCEKCNLWFYPTSFGHKTTPQDLFDMLYGDDVSDGTRWTQEHEFISNKTKKSFKAKMGFEPNTNYKIKLKFPPREPRVEAEQTGKLCPDCLAAGRNGLLVIRTQQKGANPGRKFYGCNKYPTCTYREDFVASGVFKGVPGETPAPVDPATLPPASTDLPQPQAESQPEPKVEHPVNTSPNSAPPATGFEEGQS